MSTSDIELVGVTSESAILQRQKINLLSSSPLLDLSLLITVDITSQMVVHLQVLQLSSWAEKEFGSWLLALQKGSSVATIGTVFRCYSKICSERLQCWNDSARGLSDLLFHDGNFNGLSLPANDTGHTDFTPLLGRQEFSLTREAVTLNIMWRILINEEGKVDSDVSVRPDLPEAWRQTEVGAGLAKIGEAFSKLKNERGIAPAIFVVSRLMFPG